jgi:hypothetical protein
MNQSVTLLTLGIILVLGLLVIAVTENAQAAVSKSGERWCMKYEYRGKEQTPCFPDFFQCKEYEAAAIKAGTVTVLESCHKVITK